MKFRKIFNWKVWLLTVGIALAIPLLSFVKDDDDDFELIKNLEIFHTLMRDIRIMYVDETSSGELIKNAMDKMLETLDPYTVYYPESLVEEVMFLNTGDYAGIGAEIHEIGGTFTVYAIYKDSPADKSDLMVGDVVESVNGKNVEGKTYDELEIMVKGQPGTNIQLQVSRNGVQKTIEMKRAMINVPDIPYSGIVADKIGYINLSGFTQDCGKHFREAFMKLKNDNKIEKLVIDLRGNPGGLLVEAVNIVNIFVNKGENIVDMRGRVPEWNKMFKSENAPLDTEIPIVVLVNGNSASASEIVSGALQDLDRAVIVGEKTYGKGLVQTTLDLCYNSKMKVTTAKYYIPSGRCIQKLDYSHKDSSGKASTIAESSRIFKTKNGRLVKDAGGILPDIVIDSDKMSDVTNELSEAMIFFKYANEYQRKHSNISEPETFSLTDSDLAAFKEFIGKDLYSYETATDRQVAQLEKSVSDEYSNVSDITATVATLKNQILAEKRKEVESAKEDIKKALSSEIIRRYYYDEGAIRYTLHHDPYLEKAIEVLNNSVLYQKILLGK